METSTKPPKAPRLTAEEESALVSQVLGIIGGIALEALQTLDQPEEGEAWSMGEEEEEEEEGDDSVFYSAEDPARQDVTASSTSCDLDASEHLAPRGEGAPGARERDLETGREATPRLAAAQQEEERRELPTPRAEHVRQSDAADPGAEERPNPLTPNSAQVRSGKPVCTAADMQAQSEQTAPSEKANLQVKEEEDAVLEAQTPNPGPFDVANEEGSYARPNVEEAEAPEEEAEKEEMLSAELQRPGAARLVGGREPGRGRDRRAPAGLCSNLPPPKTPGQKSFDHLTSPKYNTVSYRKIRRGNTRQRVEEFEYMMKNL